MVYALTASRTLVKGCFPATSSYSVSESDQMSDAKVRAAPSRKFSATRSWGWGSGFRI